MAQKRFAILANSIKHYPARCIAGVEIDTVSAQPTVGRWVRPVSSIGEGELPLQRTVLTGGIQPAVFDVVQVECQHACNDASQPENWLIVDGSPWIKTGTFNPILLPTLVEAPVGLWDQPNMKTDRVTQDFIAAQPPQQSLYLINISQAVLSRTGHKHRLAFTYNGRHYDLSVTDPNAINYSRSASTLQLANCYACISLAPPFLLGNGVHCHFKVVATLFA